MFHGAKMFLVPLMLIKSATGECDEAKTNSEYFECREQFKNGTACTIITNIIENCSSIFAPCRSADVIKDINVDLVKANIGNEILDLEDCEVVKEYRSEGLLPEATVHNCTKEEDTQIKRDFHDCSYGLANLVQNRTVNVTLKGANQVVCGTLHNISNSCKDILDRCYAISDRKEVYSAQMQNVMDYVQKLVQGSSEAVLPPLTLEICNITAKALSAQEIFKTVISDSTKAIEKALAGVSDLASQEQQISVSAADLRMGLSSALLLPLLLILIR